MIDNAGTSPAVSHEPQTHALVTACVMTGVVLTIVGVVVGADMGLHATRIDCPNGTYFPEGTTDFRCFAHEHAGEGTAVVIFSIMLGILIVLTAQLVSAQLTRQPGADAAA
jgi:hypothetical protein